MPEAKVTATQDPVVADAATAPIIDAPLAKDPLEIVRKWMDLAAKIYPNYPLDDAITPAMVKELVENTPVAVAMQVLMLAEDTERCTVFYRCPETGNSGIASCPSMLLHGAIKAMVDEFKKESQRPLLVKFDAELPAPIDLPELGAFAIEGLFITSRANLSALIGTVINETGAEEDGLTLTDDHFTIISDNPVVIDALVSTSGVSQDAFKEMTSLLIIGTNPFDRAGNSDSADVAPDHQLAA